MTDFRYVLDLCNLSSLLYPCTFFCIFCIVRSVMSIDEKKKSIGDYDIFYSTMAMLLRSNNAMNTCIVINIFGKLLLYDEQSNTYDPSCDYANANNKTASAESCCVFGNLGSGISNFELNFFSNENLMNSNFERSIGYCWVADCDDEKSFAYVNNDYQNTIKNLSYKNNLDTLLFCIIIQSFGSL